MDPCTSWQQVGKLLWQHLLLTTCDQLITTWVKSADCLKYKVLLNWLILPGLLYSDQTVNAPYADHFNTLCLGDR